MRIISDDATTAKGAPMTEFVTPKDADKRSAEFADIVAEVIAETPPMVDLVIPEDGSQRIVEMSFAAGNIIEQFTPEQVLDWITKGNTEHIPLLMPELQDHVERFRRIIREEYELHEEARQSLGFLCPVCRNGADHRRTIWEVKYQVWTILCECGDDYHVDSKHQG